MMTELATLQTRYAADLDRLNEHIATQLSSSNTLMNNVVSAQLRTKGKQIRPLLLILCARMFGPVTDKVISAAAAVELLHNASLIHDDVVDNSATRRGVSTINAVWDNHISVLVGDFFTSSAMQQAISTGDIRIVEALCMLGRRLSLGEIDQIFNAREHTLDVDHYFAIIDYKTASLFISSAEMGCLAVGVDDVRLDILKEYASAFGRCFQIRDDVFDYYSSDTVGKPTGNDLLEGKITLPLLYALQSAPAAEVQTMRRLLEKDSLSPDEVATLQAFARDNGGIERSYGTMRALRDNAVKALMQLPDSDERQALAGLFDFIISRNY